MARSTKWYGTSGPMSTRLRTPKDPGKKKSRRRNTKKNYSLNTTRVVNKATD